MNYFRHTLAPALAVCLLLGMVAGCNNPEKPIATGIRESPTVRLLRGELDPEEYPAQLTERNVEARRLEEVEMRKDETRAFNLVTQRYEYLPAEYQDKEWNEREQRWEFTPLRAEAQAAIEAKKRERAAERAEAGTLPDE